MSDSSEIIPEGFQLFTETSPFLDRVGPFYLSQTGPVPVFGLRILEYHCNRRGFVHGGLIMSLADITLGKTGSWSRDPPLSLMTASVTVDFLGTAKPGDWIEARTDFHQVGRQLALGNCYIRTLDHRIARASGVFNVRRNR